MEECTCCTGLCVYTRSMSINIIKTHDVVCGRRNRSLGSPTAQWVHHHEAQAHTIIAKYVGIIHLVFARLGVQSTAAHSLKLPSSSNRFAPHQRKVIRIRKVRTRAPWAITIIHGLMILPQCIHTCSIGARDRRCQCAVGLEFFTQRAHQGLWLIWIISTNGFSIIIVYLYIFVILCQCQLVIVLIMFSLKKIMRL